MPGWCPVMFFLWHTSSNRWKKWLLVHMSLKNSKNILGPLFMQMLMPNLPVAISRFLICLRVAFGKIVGQKMTTPLWLWYLLNSKNSQTKAFFFFFFFINLAIYGSLFEFYFSFCFWFCFSVLGISYGSLFEWEILHFLHFVLETPLSSYTNMVL